MADPVDIEALAGEGVAVMVATRDGELRSELARGWGPSLSEEGGRLMVCIEGSPDSAMAGNLEAGSPVAAALSRLSSHTAVQLKGPVVEVTTPTHDRVLAVAAHVARSSPRSGWLVCRRRSRAGWSVLIWSR